MSSKHAAKLQNFVHEELVWDLEKDIEFFKMPFQDITAVWQNIPVKTCHHPINPINAVLFSYFR